MALQAVGKESARLGSVSSSALSNSPAKAVAKGGVESQVGKCILGKQII